MADYRGKRRDDSSKSGKGRGRGYDRGHGRGSDKRGGRPGFTSRDRQGQGRQGDKPKNKRPHHGEFRSEDPNEPVIPAGVIADDLDREARKALSTLSGSNQEIVARHLVAAGQMLEVDPEVAYQHAQAAVKRAGRVDVVREAAALTAYASGRYEEALREVRAVRRMRGDDSLRAIEADCERGLGRPEKAIEIVEAIDLASLSLEDQVEIVLVSAGARADLGQLEYSLMVVERALEALPENSPDYLRRRLMLLQVERLRDLGKVAEADAVEAAMPEEPDVMEIVDLDAILDADTDTLRTDLRGTEQALCAEFDTALLDLDGVTFHGERVQDGGPAALTEALDAGMKLGFMTNNASRSPQEVAEKLTSMGYEAQADQVMTAATDLMIDLKEKLPAGATVLVVGSPSLAGLVEDNGFVAVTDAQGHVDAVVQGYGPNVDWTLMSEAAYAINAGAQYFATNMDATLPTERGFALGNGALVAAVTRATSKRPISAGKPRPEIFLRTAEMMKAEKPIAVGDRLDTDIAGAINARMASLHVLSGVNSARDVIRAPKGRRPSFVGIDVGALNEVHPRPLHHKDGTWTCGVSQPVKIGRGGVIQILDIELADDGDPVTLALDTYRALIAAAWDYSDERRGVRCPELRVVPNDDPAGTVTMSNRIVVEEADDTALSEVPVEDEAVNGDTHDE